MKNKKGLLRTLEVVIGILAIMGIYVIFFTGQQNLPDFQTADWKFRGFESLANLDKAGQLKPYVLNNDNTTIDNKIALLLPSSLEHQVQICGKLDCTIVSKDVAKITSVDYLIAGDAGNFTNRRVILYIWTAD